MTLGEYLRSHTLTSQESILLLIQLLEAVVHLQNYGIAHRDLKSDNILIEFDSHGHPKLAVTDFGSCLQGSIFGLKVHYSSWDVCKGGNGALMAPEVGVSSSVSL